MRFNQFLCWSERYGMPSIRVSSGCERYASWGLRSMSFDVAFGLSVWRGSTLRENCPPSLARASRALSRLQAFNFLMGIREAAKGTHPSWVKGESAKRPPVRSTESHGLFSPLSHLGEGVYFRPPS